MDQQTKSTCPYCGVGCGVIIESRGQHITAVRGDPNHPANFGRLCSKGQTLHLTASPALAQQARLLQPLQRQQRGGPLQALSWDAALDMAAQRFADTIDQHGPDAVGFYVSGQLLTEDYYVFNKLAKGLVGTNNIDTNSRLCMSSAVAGYKQTLGADAPPACYDDINHADCIFIVGSNAAWAHPVLFRRIEDARKAKPSLKLVVVDPRRTDTAECADLFLQILPGTDVALFNGLLHVMLWEGWLDTDYIAARTRGFEDLKATVRDYPPDKVAQLCSISKEDLLEAARLFAGSLQANSGARAATLSLYCQGLNQSSSGTAKNAALINLHLATGQIGRRGAGPFSLTGQPNAMGGREVGGLANLLSAHRDLGNPQHRAEVAALWGVSSVPERPGKTAVEMFQAAADGEIKALWIACTNPAQSMPDQTTVRRALERAEFVVVQETFAHTATAAYADVLLPATTWGEKDGTVTNSERRISRVRPAVQAPGQARHDWQIVVDFARRLQARGVGAPNLFPYETPEQIWNEHRESTRGRDLDITGLSYAALEAAPQQWPCPQGQTQGQQRLYTDGVFPTADGKARFANTLYQPVAEPRDARYPFALNTGRLRDQWHGMSRTGLLGRLFGHVAEPVLELHAQDMARRGLQAGALVQVSSRRGAIVVPVQASAAVGLGQAFLAMHWGEEFLSGTDDKGARLAGVNALTNPAFCPTSKQPELKHSAVKITKAELPWTLLALAWLPEQQAHTTLVALRGLMARFPFASCVPFAPAQALEDAAQNQRSGVLLRAAAHAAPEHLSELLAQLENLLGLAPAPASQSQSVLRYSDPKRGQHRALKLSHSEDQRHLQALLLSGDTRAEVWLKPLLQEGLPAQAYGRYLLQASAQAPVALPARGRQVCTCFNVDESAIQAQLEHCHGNPSERLVALQTALRCGTNCGSCLPELQRLVRATPLAQPMQH